MCSGSGCEGFIWYYGRCPLSIRVISYYNTVIKPSVTSTLFTTPHNLSLLFSLSCPYSILTSPCLTVALLWYWGICVCKSLKNIIFWHRVWSLSYDVIWCVHSLFWIHCIFIIPYLYHLLHFKDTVRRERTHRNIPHLNDSAQDICKNKRARPDWVTWAGESLP